MGGIGAGEVVFEVLGHFLQIFGGPEDFADLEGGVHEFRTGGGRDGAEGGEGAVEFAQPHADIAFEDPGFPGPGVAFEARQKLVQQAKGLIVVLHGIVGGGAAVQDFRVNGVVAVGAGHGFEFFQGVFVAAVKEEGEGMPKSRGNGDGALGKLIPGAAEVLAGGGEVVVHDEMVAPGEEPSLGQRVIGEEFDQIGENLIGFFEAARLGVGLGDQGKGLGGQFGIGVALDKIAGDGEGFVGKFQRVGGNDPSIVALFPELGGKVFLQRNGLQQEPGFAVAAFPQKGLGPQELEVAGVVLPVLETGELVGDLPFQRLVKADGLGGQPGGGGVGDFAQLGQSFFLFPLKDGMRGDHEEKGQGLGAFTVLQGFLAELEGGHGEADEVGNVFEIPVAFGENGEGGFGLALLKGTVEGLEARLLPQFGPGLGVGEAAKGGDGFVGAVQGKEQFGDLKGGQGPFEALRIMAGILTEGLQGGFVAVQLPEDGGVLEENEGVGFGVVGEEFQVLLENLSGLIVVSGLPEGETL